MSRHGKRRSAKQAVMTSLVVVLICAVAGYLFVLNVQSNGSTVMSSDTQGLLEERAKHVNQLQKDITDLSSQVETLKKTLGSDSQSADDTSATAKGANSSPTESDENSNSTASGNGDNSSSDAAAEESTASVLPAYSGPGLSVTLTDSPLWQDVQSTSNLSDSNVNDYVVHQQDLEAVVNALWAGGAESMMIQDQRVLPTTAVRCVGNVLLLQGKQYAPPYTVSAIGPTDKMQKALDSSYAINVYKQYVDSVGLGWDMKVSQKLEFPKTTAVLQTLKYASEIK
ncbi:MAG: DUF881 domain-containing protein [Bifidobacteriaceae bacterium]|jgi:uncharacterized protein YlxW (UPF0749 family)|nr:DUF881 domain-containing protein [Bifidobacteriaceae bacterium]MCI1915428.1 DUF881 domain-containing protein [Bifidobacteriaceae bacterium]